MMYTRAAANAKKPVSSLWCDTLGRVFIFTHTAGAFGNGGTTREDLFVAGAKTPPISLANSHHYQNLSDFSSNILHAAWHPEEDILACGVSNSLYIFNA